MELHYDLQKLLRVNVGPIFKAQTDLLILEAKDTSLLGVS